MSLRCLVACSDEKIIRILRRVMGDLEIEMETCPDAESAVYRLSRKRFEAVIVDCAEEEIAAQVLKSTRCAPCNKRAVAVALIDGQKLVRSAFSLGAHFVLYKPLSTERAKNSFRAARALMKRERRRNARIAVQVPVKLTLSNGDGHQQTTTSDISEGGLSVRFSRRSKTSNGLRVQFTLPGSSQPIECAAQFAWENVDGVAGVRFVDVSEDVSKQLKEWMLTQSPEGDRDDPPTVCKLTDLSLGGCYLAVTAPFPVRTRLVLTMRLSQIEVQTRGVVRVMHPEVGMGVEFSQKTQAQKDNVDKFIKALVNGDGQSPQLLVEPDGLEEIEVEESRVGDAYDPLIDLFHKKSNLPAEAFLHELRTQRQNLQAAAAATSN